MKAIYVILLLAAAFFYPMYNDNLSYILLLTLSFLPVALVLTLMISRRSIKIKVKCELEAAERGRPLKIRVRLINRSFLPVSVCGVTMKYRAGGIEGTGKFQKHKTGIPIPARSVESIIISMEAEHCGAVECVINKVKLTDLIGLLSVSKKIGFSETISIIPVIYPYETTVINSMNEDSESGVYSQTRAGGDPTEVFALREYREGDSQNRIHWKLSGRSDELVVKELSEPISSRVLMIPDLSYCKTNTDADAVLDVFASISYFLAKKRIPHSVVWRQDELTAARIEGKEDLYDLLEEQVKHLKQAGQDPVALLEYLSAEHNAYNVYSHVIFISTGVNAAFLREAEMTLNSERISVICLNKEAENEEPELLISETAVYFTDVHHFYEDLASFAI
ncbi:MAG: DUF58 domain-containing protein [Oscillospiraceae bacterium]|nr:DUF58 domain-containing protein [Oscillospiraceae bacterium]